ncbi:MAG TPA: 16S rRNA (cytidine(1402)-2'-O)-methyltransferase [Chloroflexota bacterium]|nr:16S rRNA (cytidine(1402)-2'-O)-methyltransferase [Chloroflexota bacterium]
MGVLYVVATPIGNLEDMTLRGLRVLRDVSLIAAEDTRTARVLLRHYEISTPATSFHDYTGAGKIERIIERIVNGEDVAVISEAGMPGVSDPGYRLIHEALAAGCEVTCVPGPSAALVALVLSDLPSHAFRFVGFLPRRLGERRRKLEELACDKETVIFYESPHRLVATLRDAVLAFGEERRAAVCRELTKRFEQVIRAPLAEALAHFEAHAPKGEFTVVIAGSGARTARNGEEPG